MKLSIPCFEDPDIDGLLDELPDNSTISIRGVSGAGKTHVGETILESALNAGETCRYLIVGDLEDGRESLNQATGTGIDLFSHIPKGTVAVDVVDKPGLHTMLDTIIAFDAVDLLLIDSLDGIDDAFESVELSAVEQALFWLGLQRETSVMCISQYGVGDSRPYADLTIDMDRAGEEVESLDADSILSIKVDGESVERAFLVEGYGFRMWEFE